jgi:hypothetical protein
MLTSIEKMQGEDEKDTRLLEEMAERARSYVTSFHWCPPIKTTYFAHGIGGIIAVFLFEFERKIDGTDDKVWVIAGDLPSFYEPVDPDDSVQRVLEHYCVLMDDWAAAVRTGGDFEDVFPIAAERTEKHADLLERRLAFLRKEVIPNAPTDLVTNSDGELIA